MSFQIITDSCCDFTAEQYRQMDVVSVPLAVMWNGEAHSHFSDEASLRDFYEQLRQGLTATTSALNPADWAAAMEPFLREEYGVHNVHTGYVGPILGAHTGPGVLGLFHLGKAR